MKQQTYPAYKDSGLEFVGVIPEHWNVQKLKYIASVRFSNVDKHTVEGERPVRLCNYVDVYYNDYITADLDFMKATAKPEEIRKYELKKGDVIVTKDSETWDDIAVPAYVSTDLNGVLCGYHLAQIRPHTKLVDGKYLYRSFNARGINDQFRIMATGVTRYGLRKPDLENGFFLVPTVQEQYNISAFLERVTKYIDSCIVGKERQIELLKEKRDALISQTVIKGLIPNIPMKDSGIEWLGKIPEHWVIIKIKHILAVSLAYGVLKPDRYEGNNGVPLIRILDVHNGSIATDKLEAISPNQSEEYSRTILRPGDLVISVVGTIGRSFIVPKELAGANVSRALARVQLKKEINVKLIDYYVQSNIFQSLVQLISIGTAQQVLNLGDLRNFFLTIPPDLVEQRSIVDYLDRKTRCIDTLIIKVTESIEKLREHHMAHTFAAVTGKIDVREEVI